MKKGLLENIPVVRFLYRLVQGAFIGLGAVLPGISGGVLCVVFGIYKPIMELLSHPLKNFKTHVPKLLPAILGLVVGFLGIANLLSFFLEKYPAQSVCLFVGLIAGMLPSLFREAGEKGRSKGSYISLAVAAVSRVRGRPSASRWARWGASPIRTARAHRFKMASEEA